HWHITTSQGQLTANLLILGNGPLSEPSLPHIPGIEGFEGVMFHSAQWNHDYDLTGKRVAVIGTGASSIQFVPKIQPLARHLSLFQRTPPWILPRHDHRIPSWQRPMFRILPLTQRYETLHANLLATGANSPGVYLSPQYVGERHAARTEL